MAIKSKKTIKTLTLIESITNEKLTLGKLLWAIRNSEQLTQVEFAKKLKISKQYLCDLERGRRFASAKAAADYAKILEHSQSQFVRLSLQDAMDRDGLKFVIDIKAA